MEHETRYGMDGRMKIVSEDDVLIDEETFHNLFDNGVCDTYIELPRMINLVAKDIVKMEDNDTDTILYHIDGIRQLINTCKDAMNLLIQKGKELNIPEKHMNPDVIENIDIHLDKISDMNIKDNHNRYKRFKDIS
ncbi:hypothetical protein [Thermosipho sp. (in: thermotogales)]|jgi:hypothetical protein|uniref:hypothetical protein n=1 Tax=Thermosipho sp. (in: thermotogales) TaxID=1968895 RepID=UPI00257F683A|nr:hypothetical protein [Thermosipho sp. (in: thermotogales)]MBZ4649236.1 hypothetical protein [Thermosipho sp. (in: thermotogales)]